MKSDNAPQQYKNKYFFAKLQKLADEYNVKIIYHGIVNQMYVSRAINLSGVGKLFLNHIETS